MHYAEQMTGALAAAHQQGIAHLDFKPGNIMVTREDRIVVLDFGLAKFANSRTGNEEDGPDHTICGTLHYLSPEQARGDQPGFPADMFSFGVVLWEMVTGVKPFVGQHSKEVLQAIIAEPPSLDQLPDGAYGPLKKILKKCLAKQPHERFSDMNALQGAVQALNQRFSRERDTLPLSGARPPKRRWHWILVALVISALVWLGWQYESSRPDPIVAQERPSEAVRRLAVLPFHNLEPSESDRILCDGLHENLMSTLIQLIGRDNQLWVIPAIEVRGATQMTATQARERFQADLLISGSLQRSGGILSLNLHLTDTANIRQLDSGLVQTEEGDLADLQRRALAEVASMLNLDNLAESIRQRPNLVESPDAFELFLRGEGLLYRYDQGENLSKAIAHFEQARALAPNHPGVHIGLSKALMLEWEQSGNRESLELAKKYAKHAVDLDQNLAGAWYALGLTAARAGDREAAETHFRRALSFSPRHSETNSELGLILAANGDSAGAKKHLQRAVELAPSNWQLHKNLGLYYAGQGRFADSEQAFRTVIELAPTNLVAHQNLAGVLYYQGRIEESLEWTQKALELSPAANLYSNLGTMLYYLGRFDEAVVAFEKAVARNDQNYLYWGNLADALRWSQSERNRAPQAYQKAVDLGKKVLDQNTGDQATRLSMALFLAKLGDCEQANAHLSAMGQPSQVAMIYQTAVAYEVCGQRSEAIAALKKAIAGGYSAAEVEHEPEFRELAQDPAFTIEE